MQELVENYKSKKRNLNAKLFINYLSSSKPIFLFKIHFRFQKGIIHNGYYVNIIYLF